MEASAKAKELFISFYSIITGLKTDYIENNFDLLKLTSIGIDSNTIKAKQCALKACNELINDNMPYSTDYAMNCGFWQKVKIEIEKY